MPAILAALLLVAIALVLIQFREIEKLLNDDYTSPPSPPTTARAEPTTAGAHGLDDGGDRLPTAAPAAAVVGADCSPLGTTATTANGNTVCSTLEGTSATIWSVTEGVVPSPTIT